MAVELLFKTAPRPHQEKYFLERRDRWAHALLWDMRTGKSWEAIHLVAWKFHQWEIEKVIILAPSGVHHNWIRYEFPEHCPVPWRGVSWTAASKSTKWHKDAVREVCAPGYGLGVFAVNYQSLITDGAYKPLKYLLDNYRCALIVDEAHHLRIPGSKQTKRARAVALRTACNMILTGTATADSPMGLYSMFEMLGKGTLGFTNYEAFKVHFFDRIQKTRKDGRSYPTFTFREYLRPDLHARMAPWSSVVLRGDVGGMPELRFQRVYYELAPEQRATYEMFKKACLKDIVEAGHRLDLSMAAKRIGKLQQVCSGWFYEDGAPDQATSCVTGKNPKLEALLEVVHRIKSEKFLVWCAYREDCRIVEKALRAIGVSVLPYKGGMPAREQQENYHLFRFTDKVRALVVHPKAGAEGLNFSQAKSMIWYSHPVRSVEREQGNDRGTAKDGHDVDIYDLCGLRTVEEKLLSTLQKKKDLADALTGIGLQKFLDEEVTA